MRGILRIVVVAGLGAGAISACRDASEPFRPSDREPLGGAPLRLTYGTSEDRSPVWSANGDSLYFTTSVWEQNPIAPSTVLSLPADGMGHLRELLRNVQSGSGRGNWITAPAISADGERVAFVRVFNLLDASPCIGLRVCPVMSNLPRVRLQRAELHVRAIDASNGLQDDIVLAFEYEGAGLEADPGAPTGTITLSDYHPFQFEFETEGTPFFRPSWSPAGDELVVSDGLQLLRWPLGAAEGLPIAGTSDGLMPAWSPDGEWIAFVQHERIGSQTFTCEYQNTYFPPTGPVTIADCVERRTLYDTEPPQIVLVRPDGSERIELGPGTDPAWAPDGSAVFASRPVGGVDMIVRIPVDGGTSTVVPGTERAKEPAISPDGTRLAFARTGVLDKPANHDIWVVVLP